MTIDTIITIAVITMTLIMLSVCTFFYFRDKSLNDIRADVYHLFLEVEHNPAYEKTGKQKMKWVLSRARSLLPAWAQTVVTDALLEKVVESWFRAVKDLLDDGKINKSTGGKENA